MNFKIKYLLFYRSKKNLLGFISIWSDENLITALSLAMDCPSIWWIESYKKSGYIIARSATYKGV